MGSVLCVTVQVRSSHSKGGGWKSVAFEEEDLSGERRRMGSLVAAAVGAAGAVGVFVVSSFFSFEEDSKMGAFTVLGPGSTGNSLMPAGSGAVTVMGEVRAASAILVGNVS